LKLQDLSIWKAICFLTVRRLFNRKVYRMQLTVESFTTPRSYQPGVLHEMYESPELFNEGVLSFQYPLLEASDEEMEQFIGDVVSGFSHAVGDVAKGVSKVASAIDKVVPVSKVAKGVGSVVSAVDKVVPVSLLTSTLAAPLKAGIGAAQALAEGKNVFQGAIRSLVPDIGTRFLVDTAAGVAGGQNVFKAAEAGLKAGIGDVKKSLQFAAMVAPFVPGIGTGVAAALGAANALANGEPITDVLIAAARTAVPGGQIAQTAFDIGAKLVQGKKLSDALLEEARAKLPGGPLAQAAFDVGLSLVQGKNIQEAALNATGKLLPKSPFAENALNFVKKVASGQNLQQAALSQVGNMIYQRVQQQTGPIRLPGLGAPKVPQVFGALRGLPGGVTAFGQAGKAIPQAAPKGPQARPTISLKLPTVSLVKPAPPTITRALTPSSLGAAAMKLPQKAAFPVRTTIGSAAAGHAGFPPLPTSTTSDLSTFTGAADGMAAFPGGPSAQAAFNACMASARKQCMEKGGFPGTGPVSPKTFVPKPYVTDKVAPAPLAGSDGFGQPTAAGSPAGPKISVPDSYPPSPDKIVESGQLPAFGIWQKRNGEVRVVGAYA
jgi:hypothetical protein